MIKEHNIRLVITDWMMPKMDGLALCRAIRDSRTSGYVFVIILTARDEKGSTIAGLEAGADDFLAKPFDRGEFMARVKTGLRILDLESSLHQANERILKLSLTDGLTGCYNRRYLFEQLPKELKRAMRQKKPFSIIMQDIDHFKRVNDEYGHPAGDEVLKEISRRTKTCVRTDVDWVVRYGGEEFLIVIPDADSKSALSVAERIRSTISDTPIKANDHLLNLTSSLGVAGIDGRASKGDIEAESLIKCADAALYKSKREGRNRVSFGNE